MLFSIALSMLPSNIFKRLINPKTSRKLPLCRDLLFSKNSYNIRYYQRHPNKSSYSHDPIRKELLKVKPSVGKMTDEMVSDMVTLEIDKTQHMKVLKPYVQKTLGVFE